MSEQTDEGSGIAGRAERKVRRPVPERCDYVIEMDAVGGPCWVATGGGDPERTHRLDHAEVYATEREAAENAEAFRRKHPGRRFYVNLKPPNAKLNGPQGPHER